MYSACWRMSKEGSTSTKEKYCTCGLSSVEKRSFTFNLSVKRESWIQFCVSFWEEDIEPVPWYQRIFFGDEVAVVFRVHCRTCRRLWVMAVRPGFVRPKNVMGILTTRYHGPGILAANEQLWQQCIHPSFTKKAFEIVVYSSFTVFKTIWKQNRISRLRN